MLVLPTYLHGFTCYSVSYIFSLCSASWTTATSTRTDHIWASAIVTSEPVRFRNYGTISRTKDSDNAQPYISFLGSTKKQYTDNPLVLSHNALNQISQRSNLVFPQYIRVTSLTSFFYINYMNDYFALKKQHKSGSNTTVYHKSLEQTTHFCSLHKYCIRGKRGNWMLKLKSLLWGGESAEEWATSSVSVQKPTASPRTDIQTNRTCQEVCGNCSRKPTCECFISMSQCQSWEGISQQLLDLSYSADRLSKWLLSYFNFRHITVFLAENAELDLKPAALAREMTTGQTPGHVGRHILHGSLLLSYIHGYSTSA